MGKLAVDTPSISLTASVEVLKGVGGKVAARLARLGIREVQDALWHLPLRYQDRSRLVPIAELQPGREALFQGEVISHEIRYGRRRMLLVLLADDGHKIVLRFFQFSSRQQRMMEKGCWLRCYGEVREKSTAGKSLPNIPVVQQFEVMHPEFSRVQRDAPLVGAEGVLTPVYPLVEGVGQSLLRSVITQALALLDHAEDVRLDWVPDAWLTALDLPSLRDALRMVHRPGVAHGGLDMQDGSHPVQRRLALEELLAQQLGVRQARRKLQQRRAPSLAGPDTLRLSLQASLPFSLTAAQQRVVAEIIADLNHSQPMQRLVQGDVGSGKTVLAALAVAQAVDSGYQAAVMAPTEILAEQHLHNFTQWLAPFGVQVAWLSGKMTAQSRREMLAVIASGAARVIVGTHALFQDEVEFERLGLVVIDEQHRFGVKQRMALLEKGAKLEDEDEPGGRPGQLTGRMIPHQLIMTATPIPRTLVMTAYADLDCSVVDELPPGRQPVNTVVLQDSRRDAVLERVRSACAEGRQAYWVCTLVEESDALQCQAAEDAAVLLAEYLSELRVGLVHGRMKSAEKEQVMAAYKAHQLDVLVATTVIEVGVDVPNATLMVIEDAQRLGLSQLHQLRGRVGRGQEQSHCVLMYRAPLSARGRDRLAILRKTTDGFEVARRDLELRGPGEVLGTKQAGEVQFRVADLLRDQDLIPVAGKLAERMLNEYPQRVAPLVRRWLGESDRYLNV